MAKLTRVPAKVFAASAAADEIGQFGSAVAGSKLETADVATIQGLSAWLSGWSEALASGNRYPALQEMNGSFKVLSYQGAYALQEGIPEYDASTSYYIGSIVKKTGTFELYGSLTDDNVGNALTVDTEWKFLCDLNTIGQDITQIGSSSTASATAEKAVTLSGFVLTTGATIQVIFTNTNTATTPTLNVNSTGAKAIYNEAGTAVGANNPAYFPAGSTVEFTYNGTYWVYKNKIITNYVNGTSWYRQWANGFINQGGLILTTGTSSLSGTFLKPFSTYSSGGISMLGNISEQQSSYTCQLSLTSNTTFVYKVNASPVSLWWEAKGY